jgi:hypothetical protein
VPSTQRRSGYLIIYLAPRRLPAVLVAQLLCARGDADHRSPPCRSPKMPRANSSAMRARAATSTTTRRRPGRVAPGRQPAEGRSFWPWRASLAATTWGATRVSMRVLTTEVGPCGCPRWPSRPQCGRSRQRPCSLARRRFTGPRHRNRSRPRSARLGPGRATALIMSRGNAHAAGRTHVLAAPAPQAPGITSVERHHRDRLWRMRTPAPWRELRSPMPSY